MFAKIMTGMAVAGALLVGPATADAGPTNGCDPTRPCITELRQDGIVVKIGWDGRGDHEAYRVSFREAGKPFEVQQTKSRSYEIRNVEPNTRYDVQVQSCDTDRGLFVCSFPAESTITTSPNLPYGPDTCKVGFVWREANPADHVCVIPETRTETAQDNAHAGERRSPNGGPYGPDTCKNGFVWREAYPNDHVCVVPETRDQARRDNAAAGSTRILG